MGMTMARSFPDEMREKMHPLMDKYLAEFEFDLTSRSITLDGREQPNPAHRTAMDLYPRIMRAIGASDDLIEALLRRLSMPHEAALLEASELYRAVQGKDVHEIYRECKRMCEWYENNSVEGL